MSPAKPTRPKLSRRMAREPEPRVDLGAQIPASPKSKCPTKAGLVLELLNRPEGCSLDALVEATGWQAHTTRAVLTGLRKKGHVLISVKPEAGSRIYRIIADGREP